MVIVTLIIKVTHSILISASHQCNCHIYFLHHICFYLNIVGLANNSNLIKGAATCVCDIIFVACHLLSKTETEPRPIKKNTCVFHSASALVDYKEVNNLLPDKLISVSTTHIRGSTSSGTYNVALLAPLDGIAFS